METICTVSYETDGLGSKVERKSQPWKKGEGYFKGKKGSNKRQRLRNNEKEGRIWRSFHLSEDSLDRAGVLVANKEESPARVLQGQACILWTSLETSLKAVLPLLSKVMTPIHFFFYLTELC